LVGSCAEAGGRGGRGRRGRGLLGRGLPVDFIKHGIGGPPIHFIKGLLVPTYQPVSNMVALVLVLVLVLVGSSRLW
jgi:hypothetical protein